MWCWILSACITYFNVLPSVSTKFKMSILIYEMEMVFAIVLFLWIAVNVIVFEIWKIKERCEMEAIILIENILKSCLFSSYYNLSDVSHDSVNKFLSYLIEKSLVELENSYCIEIGEVGLSHISIEKIAQLFNNRAFASSDNQKVQQNCLKDNVSMNY